MNFENYFIKSYKSWDSIDSSTIILHNCVLKRDVGPLRKGSICDMVIGFEGCFVQFIQGETKLEYEWKPVLKSKRDYSEK